MRILAVRGSDLTSLAGAFEIDFEAEPLASAGIFAITGPTGAGKSTLLDAICLALFNYVPRLDSVSSGLVGASGGETLSTGDPRALLRHRAGEGHAEVDFVGLDGARYRARWTVRRARGRPDGALQNVQHTLTNLDTREALGGTRTETLAKIQRLVGLTPHQFGRAVMLAQGDFNAFIDADANTRAELLEKLTGTQLYARLGMAARTRAETLRRGLVDIEARIAAQNGMDDVARGAAEARLADARGCHASAAAELAARERDRGWHARAAELATLVEAAGRGHAAARDLHDAAAPRRAALGQRRLAHAVVPTWRAAADADAKVTKTVERIAVLAADAEAARARAAAALEADGAAARTLADAEAELDGRRPELEDARALDRRLVALEGKLAPLAEARSTAAAQAETSREAHVRAAETRDHAAARRAALAVWIEANRPRGVLSARRDDLAADIAEYGELAARATELGAARVSIAGRVDGARAAAAAAETAAGAARTVLADAESDLGRAGALVPAASEVDAVERSRDALMAVEPMLLAFERASSDLERLVAADAAGREAHARLGEAVTGSAARRDAVDAELPRLRARHQEAVRAAALSAAASGDAAERLRRTLVDGEPCPVCGATDHAISALASLIDGRAHADAERVSELAAGISRLERERAVLADRAEGDGARLSASASAIAKAADAVAAARYARAGALDELGGALLSCGIADGSDPGSARNEVGSRLREIDARRATFAAAREAAQVAAKALDDARSEALRTSDAERAVVQGLRDLEAAAKANAERLTDIAARRDRVGGELDAALSPHFEWRVARSPAATLDELVREWRAEVASLTEVDAELPGLVGAAHEADVVKGRDALRLDEAARVELNAREERDRTATDRAAMLGGEVTEAVVSRLEEAVRVAASRRERMRAANDAARAALAAATGAHGQALAALAVDEAEGARRRRTLADEIASRGVDAASVEAAVAEEPNALDDEALALEELDRAVVAAKAELRSRAADRDAHASTDVPGLGLHDLEAALVAARQVEAATRDALGEADMVIRQDDRAREATAELRASLERARAEAMPWFQLEDLIGDATGNKFRRYAQGLTLERLLLHANARLAELKPRYSLERAPGGEMLVQVVDNDMAGEVRGLSNLSGGERFLVSLALALGLSEMSTGNGLRVESLFIDEGFGALDSASLGQAIGVLEHLHATGRRVGVISHVEEVKERIAVKISVEPASGGSSTVEVLDG